MDYGELVIPIAEGALGPEHVAASLGEVVSGVISGRTTPTDITVFLSGGIAAEYVAASSAACRIADQHGLGAVIDLTP